ncbi:MAG: PTS sugar transporter subunit IIA [Ignavibacteria bacterium]|jgi:fructose-specific phosphotransferase system IIA component
MKICELISPGKILSGISVKNKSEIIDKLVDLFKEDNRVIDIDKLRESVHEREKIMSTGVGKGFAIPHAKTKSTKDILMAFAKLDVPIDFDALDGEPVDILFLLIARDTQVSQHIKLLSRISRMINEEKFRRKILSAEDAGQLHEIICSEEKKYL